MGCFDTCRPCIDIHVLRMIQTDETRCLLLYVRGPKGLFAVEWLSDGAAALKAGCNGRYLTARMNGSLQAVSEEISDRERFTLTLVNRPRLVLRCDHGFVGVKTAGSGGGLTRYECNRASHDPVKLIHASSRQESCPAENGTQQCGITPVAFYYFMGMFNEFAL